MICWIRHTLITPVLVTISGVMSCQQVEKSHATLQSPSAETGVIEQQNILNCPSRLESHLYKIPSHGDQVWLRFQIQENPDFNASLGDDCKGDLKNLWTDFNRSEALIEKHSMHISHISQILGRSLDHFPVTKKQLKYYVDARANELGLNKKLNSIDRSTLKGGMEVNYHTTKFVMQSLQAYLDEEHKPIIEEILSKSNIGMTSITGEKLSYCYKSFDRCIYLPDFKNRPKDDNLDLEFIAIGYDWWTFENDKHTDSE